MVRLSSRAKTRSARGMPEEPAEYLEFCVTMIDDHQLQARVHQGIDLSALTVGEHGDFGIGI